MSVTLLVSVTSAADSVCSKFFELISMVEAETMSSGELMFFFRDSTIGFFGVVLLSYRTWEDLCTTIDLLLLPVVLF